MKLDSLGLNHSVFFSATCQTVRPRSSALSSGHLKIAPPHSSSARPRCCLYQAASCLWSDLDLKNTPPIPVTLAMGCTMPEAEMTGKRYSTFETMLRASDRPSVPGSASLH